MPLPKEGTKEWDDEVLFYLSSSRSEVKGRSKQLGLSGIASYEARMRERGIWKSRECQEIKAPEFVFNLPKVNLKEYRCPKINGDEEVMILHCGDGHAGKITKSFNKEVYRQRMETMYKHLMAILELHRKLYPIRKLYIINTGDNVQGENPFQGSRVESIEMGAMNQVIKIALPAWNDLVFSLAQNFEEIEMHMFPGNHGRISREAPETSNWDLMLYNAMKDVYEREKFIAVNVHEEFGDVVVINGFKFFCTHLDDIPCQSGTPYFAIDKAVKSWYMQFGGFNYMLGGHFHKRHEDEISSKTSYFLCSTLVSDDDWVLKKLKISSNPSQNIFGCHPKIGLTWRYPLIVDDKFLPEKF